MPHANGALFRVRIPADAVRTIDVLIYIAVFIAFAHMNQLIWPAKGKTIFSNEFEDQTRQRLIDVQQRGEAPGARRAVRFFVATSRRGFRRRLD
jgi:hypothetical protein